MAGYESETARLQRAYDEAVGWALAYGIKVYEPGGRMKCLGDLREEIAAVRGVPEAPWPLGLATC